MVLYNRIEFEGNLKMSKEKSIRIRGGHRAYVSKIIESANEILEHFSGSTRERE